MIFFTKNFFVIYILFTGYLASGMDAAQITAQFPQELEKKLQEIHDKIAEQKKILESLKDLPDEKSKNQYNLINDRILPGLEKTSERLIYHRFKPKIQKEHEITREEFRQLETLIFNANAKISDLEKNKILRLTVDLSKTNQQLKTIIVFSFLGWGLLFIKWISHH